MFCIHCGKENPDESTYCLRCGEKMVDGSGIGTGRLILAACAAGVSVVFALMSIYGERLKPAPRPAVTAAATPALTPTPVPSPPPTEIEILPGNSQSLNVVKRSMTLQPKTYEIFPFEVPEISAAVKLEGEVTASGGGKDDIYVLVLDESGIDDFRSRRDPGIQPLTRVNGTRRISLNLPAGKYYLVLSNAHARYYSKRVWADLSLVYE